MPSAHALRWLAGAVVVGFLLVIASISGAEVIEKSEDPSSPSPSPSTSGTPTAAPPTIVWEQAPEGATRNATVLFDVSREESAAAVTVTVRLDLDRDDPLLRNVRADLLGGDEIMEALGVPLKDYYNYARPVVSWSRGVPRASISMRADGGAVLDQSQVRLLLVDPARAALARRDVTVVTTGMQIIETEGGGLVSQEAHRAEFSGAREQAAVTVWGSYLPSAETDADEAADPSTLSPWAEYHPLAILPLVLAPWVVLAVGLRLRARRMAAIAALVGVVLTVDRLPGFGFGWQPITSPPVLAFCALLLCAAILRAAQGRTWDGGALLGALAVTGAAAIPLAWYGAEAERDTSASLRPGWLAFGALAAVATGAMGFRLVGRPWRSGAAAGAGVFGFACLWKATDPAGADGVAFLALLGVLCAAILGAGLLPAFARFPDTGPRISTIVTTLVLGLLMFVPVIGLRASGKGFFPEPDDVDLPSPFYIGGAFEHLLLLTLLVAAVRYLDRRGRRPAAAGDAICGTLLLVLVLIVTIEHGDIAWLNLVAFGYVLVVWRWMIDRSDGAAALERISRTDHDRLVGAEIRRRIAALSAHDFYRSARQKLNDDLTLSDYSAKQQRLDDAASDRNPVAGFRPSQALATSAGRTAWETGVTAMKYAAPAAVAFGLYELFLLLSNEENYELFWGTLPEWLIVLARHFRWLVYALVFGFAYPRLRGRTPVTKALALAVFLLPVELLSMLSAVPEYQNPDDPEADEILLPSTADVIAAAGIRTGQVVTFCLFLGLCWERHLVTLAGYGWDRIRNFRSFGSIATPAGTIVIAVATAAGTALAGAAVSAMLGTGAPSPPPAAPPSATVTPAPSRT